MKETYLPTKTAPWAPDPSHSKLEIKVIPVWIRYNKKVKQTCQQKQRPGLQILATPSWKSAQTVSPNYHLKTKNNNKGIRHCTVNYVGTQSFI